MKQLASITLVRSVVLPVTVPDSCDHTWSADGELYFLVCIRQQTTLSIHRLNCQEGEVLSVGLNYRAVCSDA